MLELFLSLLLLTSGHVYFDRTAPLDSVASGRYKSAEAEVHCAKPYSGTILCPEGNFVVRTGGFDHLDVVRKRLESKVSGWTELMVHELAHVWDGMDNGLFDGSPGHGYSDNVYPRGSHCLDNKAEWYACEVTRTGRLQ